MATRNERVILSLTDDFTPGMAKAAAATALLNRELGRLSGQELAASRSSQTFVRDVQAIGRAANGTESQIDRLSGRLRILGEAAAIFGPAGAPLGGVAVAGLAGLSAQLGFAAVGAGVFMASMKGVGDALKAVNKAAIDPSKENIESANEALRQLSETSRQFVYELRDIGPALKALRDAGAEEMIPGLTESLDNLERFLPTLDGLMRGVAGTIGDVASDITGSLASDRWAPFIDFLEAEAPDAITELSATMGALAHGLTDLWITFQPLNDDFSSWLLESARSFEDWSASLSQTDGFEEFMAFVEQSGPQVAATLGAVGDAAVQVVQAVAPLGGPSLAIIQTLAEGLGAIADSDLGTPLFAAAAGLAAYNRSLAITTSLQTRLGGAGILGMFGGQAGVSASSRIRTLSADIAKMSGEYGKVSRAQSLMISGLSNTTGAAQRTRASLGGLARDAGRTAGPIAGIAAASGLLGDSLDKNAVSLGLMGAMFGPWGALVGAGTGALMDFKAAGDAATSALDALREAQDRSGSNLGSATSDDVTVLSEQIAAAKAELDDLNEYTGFKDFFSDIAGDLFTGGVGEGIDSIYEKQIEAGEKALDRLSAAAARNAKAQNRADVAATAAGGSVRRLTDDLLVGADGMLVSEDAMNEWRVEIAKSAQAFLGLGDSLNDSKVSLDGWLQQLQQQANALRNFRVNAEEAADNGLRRGLIDALREAGPEGAMRMAQLAGATKAQIARANEAWASGQSEVKKYVKSVEDAAKPREGKFTLDAREGMSAAALLRAEMNRLDGLTATTYVNTVRTVTGPMGGAAFSQKATGGPIVGPGSKTSDDVPVMASNGEFMMRAAAVDHYGLDTMFKMNALRLAGGGSTDGKSGERARREEERRQRQLDQQRTRDLLASDLRDEQEQARLEARDAKRRLRSAREADRPKSEIREAQLALKGERADLADMREEARIERKQKADDRLAKLEEERIQAEQEQADAIFEGQQRAWDVVTDSAKANVDAAKTLRDSVQANMDRIGQAATSAFQSDWFGGGQKQSGLFVGSGTGSGNWRSKAQSDIAGLEERKNLIAQLSGQGLKGSALENLLANQSNKGIAAMLKAGEIGDYAALFAQREALTGQVSAAAGQAGYGSEWAAANEQFELMNRQLVAIEAAIAAARSNYYTVNETLSAAATAAEIARLEALARA